MWEMWVWSLGWAYPQEKGKATHSRIPRTIWSIGSQRVRHDEQLSLSHYVLRDLIFTTFPKRDFLLLCFHFPNPLCIRQVGCFLILGKWPYVEYILWGSANDPPRANMKKETDRTGSILKAGHHLGPDCGLWAICPVSMETTYQLENQALGRKSPRACT